jgi:hypothetical protein
VEKAQEVVKVALENKKKAETHHAKRYEKRRVRVRILIMQLSVIANN